ncbi:MAG: 3-dehydroquinate synthase [Chlamydiia bacterium]|nr:3-dehydroquinate synthase [Chlamydiia bacterium]
MTHVIFGRDAIDWGRYSSVNVLADARVWELHGDERRALLIPSGEGEKSLRTAERCWEQLVKWGVDRQGVLVGFGGGVVTDLAGFVGSVYQRGIAVVLVPTTVIGMVDAAIGGKTGVNFGGVKNVLGTFWEAEAVVIDLDLLKTLPEREYRSGLAEVIKLGVIWDGAFFCELEREVEGLLQREKSVLERVIRRAQQIKCEVVERDPQDRLGVRCCLNWGHTFGHALEAVTGFATYTHGEAVAMGMHVAARVSCDLGMVDQAFVTRQQALLEKVGLKTTFPPVEKENFWKVLQKDKKNGYNQIQLILSQGFGKFQLVSSLSKERILSFV